MARIDNSLGWQDGQSRSEALHQLGPRAAMQIGAAYAHAEKRVASEDSPFGLAPKDDAARRMSRGVDHFQVVGSETDLVAVFQVVAQWWYMVVIADANHVTRLLVDIKQQFCIVNMNLWLKPKLIADGVHAKNMIHVAVSAEQVARLQLLFAHIVDNSLALGFIVGTAVNDDGFAGRIAHDVAILLQHIDAKALDVYHRGT